MNRKIRFSRIVYLCITVLYLFAVVWATVYAQTGYFQNLPVVEIGFPHNGLIPKSCVKITPENEQLYVNTVIQDEGPWGKRYIIDTVNLINYQDIDEDYLLILGATKIENPIVYYSSAELYRGLEVRMETEGSPTSK